MQFREIKWSDVYGLAFEGGSYLGTKRMVPPEDSYSKVAQNFNKFKIAALLIIGGFEVYSHFLENDFVDEAPNFTGVIIESDSV